MMRSFMKPSEQVSWERVVAAVPDEAAAFNAALTEQGNPAAETTWDRNSLTQNENGIISRDSLLRSRPGMLQQFDRLVAPIERKRNYAPENAI